MGIAPPLLVQLNISRSVKDMNITISRHTKQEGSDQNLQISEYISNKNCNSSSTGRHTKLIKRKFDFKMFDFDVIIIH